MFWIVCSSLVPIETSHISQIKKVHLTSKNNHIPALEKEVIESSLDSASATIL